jgi:hypothetical protein
MISKVYRNSIFTHGKQTLEALKVTFIPRTLKDSSVLWILGFFQQVVRDITNRTR